NQCEKTPDYPPTPNRASQNCQTRERAGFHGRNRTPTPTRQNTETSQTSREVIESLEKQLGKRAAAWRYHDAEGGEAGAVIRWDRPDGGKTIRPIRHGDDGWSVGAMLEPRPLYRLPSLSKSELVYVTEGEKAAEAGVAIGLNVTTSPGGCKAPAKADWSPLAGKEVVILPDHDDAGEKYAETVAGILTRLDPPAKVKIVHLREIWPDLPEKGDLDDWYEAHVGIDPETLRDQLETLVASVELWQLERPRQAVEPFEPFPVDALPQVVRALVNAGSDAIGCDPAFIALPVLSVLGASIGNTRRLRLKPGWDVPPIIWTAIVGRSGSQKSPAWKLALSAVNELEKEADRRWHREYAEYRAAVAEQKRDRRTAGESADSEELSEQPTVPIAERFVVSDTTIEALAPLLLENPRGLLLTVDELVGWLGSFDRFNRGGRASADAGRWLSMFNAAPLRVDRKTGEPRTIYVPSAAVSVCGGIQPGTLRKAIGTEHRENGLLARMLLAYPPPRSRRWSEAAINASSVEPFTELLRSLRRIEFERDRIGEPVSGIVELSQAAKHLFCDFYNEHAQEQETLDDDLAAAWSKLEEYAARLALIIHVCRHASGENVNERKVDESSMAAGIELTRWFCRETRRVYAVLEQNETERACHELAEWIRRKGGEVSVPEVQGGHRRFRTSIEAESALEELVSMELGYWQPVDTTRRGGRPSRRFVLFPA
ncbi:MAG: DUF3987 domain-containing protein, partial [Planctomycetota bacterium]|nr:DUF3987 domain-containing protein [Planctomycetota bacterium]